MNSTIALQLATVSIESAHYEQIAAFSFHSQSIDDHRFVWWRSPLTYSELACSCAIVSASVRLILEGEWRPFQEIVAEWWKWVSKDARFPCEPQLFLSVLQNIFCLPSLGESRGSAFVLSRLKCHWGFMSLCRCTYSQHFLAISTVLFFFHCFFLMSIILLIGLTDHSSFTGVLGWGEVCSGWDPWKSIPEEANLQGKINQSLVLVEEGLKTIKSTEFSGLFLQLSQPFC